jgi:WD40 repeat protein
MSVASMAFSADGKWLGLGTDGVTVYDTQTKSVHWASQPKRPTTTAVSFSPDGKWLAAGSGSFSEKDGLLSLYRIDGDSFECKGDFPHAQGVMCTRFSGDSQWLAAGDYAGKIVVYDLSTASPSETMSAHRMAVQCLEFSPDGKTLVSGAFNGSMKFWRVGRWEELGEVPHRNAVQGLRFYSSPSKGLGLLIGRRVTAAAPAEQEVHWIKQKDDDWNWLR